ncbi:MAG: alpha/beta hydrolase [Eisenbergiella sp.]|uniref:alpha/beta hydrolase n=1 Tax=unclassified Eisenbergiella TaxID=2652273 RepID=UPI0015FA23DA|nr:alpha/beta hydrolase [Eisenbergiella sp. OF01-20]MBS5533905.1 alpha/beta hydrolase [Lachnospiraceae bacterium]
MAINRAMRTVLKALSYGDINVQSSRAFANIKAIDPLRRFYKTIDTRIYNGSFEVPTRIYLPGEELPVQNGMEGNTLPVLLFLHGGGWITESVDTYTRVCAGLAKDTGHVVVSVGYRLAPEFRFPAGLEDCYAVARAIYTNRFLLNVDPSRITLIGDSAGGNLAAALSLMARDRGEFMPRQQILIYPAVSNDYSEASPFSSVRENGSDFLLTRQKLCQYLDYYQSDGADRQNPYFAPILEPDLSGQPRTLILTAQFDPLRDEGEWYGKRLKDAGNEVEIHRIQDALHGFFALGIKYFHVQESYTIINQFLKENE